MLTALSAILHAPPLPERLYDTLGLHACSRERCDSERSRRTVRAGRARVGCRPVMRSTR
jgi:hypothetical protein